jgi:hypothetical protein
MAIKSLLFFAALYFIHLLSTPYVSGTPRSWEDAYQLAATFMQDLSQEEKLAIMTGTHPSKHN